jgi:acetylornithine deacetylase/succinyl-diaminopimelate desuccinylase-like protein
MNRVRNWLVAHRQQAIDLLSLLCRQPSISTTGEGIAEMGPLVVDTFRSLGFESRLVPTAGTPMVFARDPRCSGGKSLLFYNHYDVQPVGNPAEWRTPPFEPTVIDDRLYARGATDNKGNIVSRLMAMLALHALGMPIPINVKFMVDGEEESGSPHLLQAMQANRDLLTCDWCIWEDTFREDPEALVVSLGSKAMFFMQLECEVGPVDIHSAFAPAFENAAWRLVHAAASLRDPHGKVLIPGFYDLVVPLTETESALLDALPPMPEKQAKAHTLAYGRSPEEARRALITEPTCNIQGIQAGYTGKGHKNALLARAVARVDMRLVPNQNPATIAQQTRAWLDANGFQDVKIVDTSIDGRPSRYRVGDLVSAVTRAAGPLYERGVVVEPGGAGCTPIWMVGAGLGCQETANLGVGVLGSNTHAPNESVAISEILRFAEVMARAMLSLGGVDPTRLD